jgi:hypothetical protein
MGHYDVISGAPSDEPEALENASDAFSRIEGKVFDAHLGANKFDFRGLDADSLLLFPMGLSFTVVLLDQVFEHDRKALSNGVLNVLKSLLFRFALREASGNFQALGDGVTIFACVSHHS